MVRSLLKRPAAKETKGLSNRARWCRTCNQLKRDGPRHKHDNPTHEVVKLTADQMALYDSEDAEDTGAKVPRFNFGKYKGKTVEEVKETCPSYLFWVFQNRKDLFPKYKWLRSALLEANVFPAELLDREDDADDRAREVIDAIAAAGAASSSSGAVPVEHVMPKAKPQGPWEGLSEKKRQRAITLFKSVPPEQRSPSWSSKAPRKALEPLERTGLELKRASPLELVQMMLADGILTSRTGEECQNPSCSQWGVSDRPVLGQLATSDEGKLKAVDISSHNCCYSSLLPFT